MWIGHGSDDARFVKFTAISDGGNYSGDLQRAGCAVALTNRHHTGDCWSYCGSGAHFCFPETIAWDETGGLRWEFNTGFLTET